MGFDSGKGGFVKIYRSLLNDEIWTEENAPFDKRSAWLYLLLRANYEDRDVVLRYSVVHVKRGQFWTSVRKLSEQWFWTRKRVEKYLGLLKRTGKILVSSSVEGTLITIVKYGSFQGCGDTEVATGVATGVDTSGDTEVATGVARIRNKEIKNVKNGKKENSNGFDFPLSERDLELLKDAE